METNTRRYVRYSIYSMIAYVITLALSIIALGFFADYPMLPTRVVLALTPVIPVTFMVYSFLKYLGSIDELQQRIQLLAIGFAAGTTCLMTFSYGFLEVVGFPPISPLWIFPTMILLWGLGLVIISRRFE
jgi:hypothetical protein